MRLRSNLYNEEDVKEAAIRLKEIIRYDLRAPDGTYREILAYAKHDPAFCLPGGTFCLKLLWDAKDCASIQVSRDYKGVWHWALPNEDEVKEVVYDD